MTHGIDDGSALPRGPVVGQKGVEEDCRDGQRRVIWINRTGRSTPGTHGEISEESWLEVVPVRTMVEGVKSRGVSCFLFIAAMSSRTYWLPWGS